LENVAKLPPGKSWQMFTLQKADAVKLKHFHANDLPIKINKFVFFIVIENMVQYQSPGNPAGSERR